MSETIDAGGLRVRYELTGDPEHPVVVLIHALGTDLGLWDAQADALARSFRVLRYDLRGHGGTTVTPGPYTIDTLGNDLLALLDALAIPNTHFAGVSLGGFVGQWIAAHAPARVNRLVLSNTAAQIGTAAGWNSRISLVRQQGIEAVLDGSIERWFTPSFIAREPATIDAIRQILERTSAEGYASCCEAARDMDLRASAPTIRARTLVIAGDADQSTTPADAEWLASHIPGGRAVVLSAAHLANVEARDAFNAELTAFLSGVEA